jgi:hypothetical protein
MTVEDQEPEFLCRRVYKPKSSMSFSLYPHQEISS